MNIRLLSPLVPFLILLSVGSLLGACSSGNGDADRRIQGVVLLPAQVVAARNTQTWWARLQGLFIRELRADVTGLVPVANTTVELVRLDSQGNVAAVLDSTTSDASGNYSFVTSEPPSSDLAVRLPAEANPTRAIVTETNIDVTPVSEAVVRSIIDEIAASGTVLGNYTVSEVAALVDLVSSMDIDLSTAPDFESAVNTVLAEANPTLGDMTRGYGTPGAVNTLASKQFSMVGQNTTLVPPPQFNGQGPGIDHRTLNGAFGFSGNATIIGTGNEQVSLLISDLLGSSFFCDVSTVFGRSFIPAANGQVSITAQDGSGTVLGALSADGRLMVYPAVNFVAGVGGNASGLGRGLRVALSWENRIPDGSINRNTVVSGDYNVLWSAVYMNPGGGMGTGGLGGGGTITATNGSALVNFDTVTAPDAEGRNPFTSTNPAVSSVTLDLADGSVTVGSAPDSLSGVYEVLPSGGMIAILGDPPTLMSGGSGSNDFLQGAHIQTPDGQVAGLLALSASINSGTMGTGGNLLGMTDSNCGGGGTGTPDTMMGGSAGEGRGIFLAAPATGTANSAIAGTYNAVAQITRFTQDSTNGTALVESEYRYGTLSFDGAGNVTGGNLFYKRATLDVAAALAGDSTAVASSTATVNYTGGTYSVGSVDGVLNLSLTGGDGLTLGTGFAALNGELLVLPVEWDGSATGARGVLLLLRQP